LLSVQQHFSCARTPGLGAAVVGAVPDRLPSLAAVGIPIPGVGLAPAAAIAVVDGAADIIMEVATVAITTVAGITAAGSIQAGSSPGTRPESITPSSTSFLKNLIRLIAITPRIGPAKLYGILNGSELAKTPSSAHMSNAGVVVALFVSVSLLAGQAASLRVRWARTAVRVAGSWIAAIGY
jgi:hypothetical protein